MEKKTIGAFIAMLRKVNGMTQKDLAEKLGVSDKTVSHWERDESAPDLTLIPVIAEIFGVTCDELIRGERIKDASEDGKTEKQVRHLLYRSRMKFKTRSMISLGLSLAGLFAALICNFGFNRAYLGFLIGCIFWASAVVCEWVVCSYAFSAVGGDEFDGAGLSQKPSVFGDPAINDYRIYTVRLTGKMISVPVIMLFASLPLVLIPYDTFVGITAGPWLGLGLLLAAAAAVICLFAVYAVNNALIRKGIYTLDKSADIKRHQYNRLKVRCIAVITAILLVIFLGQVYFNRAFGPEAFAAGTSFDNFDDFKAYMETEKESNVYTGDTALQLAAADTDQYFDMNGNPTTKEQALTEYIYDNAGNVLYQYVHLNREVAMTRYTITSTGGFSATAYTFEQMRAGEAGRDFVNIRWAILYFVAAGIGFVVYFRKRKKLA